MYASNTRIQYFLPLNQFLNINDFNNNNNMKYRNFT